MVVNNIVILVGFFRKDKFSRIAVSQIFREVLFLIIRAFSRNLWNLILVKINFLKVVPRPEMYPESCQNHQPFFLKEVNPGILAEAISIAFTSQ